MAKHFENGAKKYSARNWELGQPLTRYLDSAIRHIYCYLEGNRDEDHVIAGAWNLLALVHTEEMIKRGQLPKELNDLPNYNAQEKKQCPCKKTELPLEKKFHS